MSDTEYPHCGCADFWPGQGHHPDCPVRHKFETLERENATMREQIEHLGKANSMLNLDLVDAHAETAKETKRADKLEAGNAAMREVLREAHESIDMLITAASGGMQPANGRLTAIKNGNAILTKLQPFLKP